MVQVNHSLKHHQNAHISLQGIVQHIQAFHQGSLLIPYKMGFNHFHYG
jgi:hypothetical protein